MHPNLSAALKTTADTLTENGVSLTESLVSFSDGGINTPAGNIYPFLSATRTSLKDVFVDGGVLKAFVTYLAGGKHIIRLNHTGFCYKVASKQAELDRLAGIVKRTHYHLYQEPSNDEGLWLFLGNTSCWENPMVEFVPVESTHDPDAPYWLPHIQFDIDTDMTDTEIISSVRRFFGHAVYPFPISIGGTVYIVRNRLGTADGINITLDLATRARNVRSHREHVLKQLV